MADVDEELRYAVDSFLGGAGVDPRAQDALRALPAELQRHIIGRGSLSTARNPSSVLLARIRDAESDPSLTFAAAGPGADLSAMGTETTWVRMRGLPFSASVDDILNFFDGFWPLPDVVLGKTGDGRASGEAFVPFDSHDIAQVAIEERQKKDLGGRYIELFLCTADDVNRGASGMSQPSAHERRGFRDLSQEVEAFLEHNNVPSGRGADALRTSRPEVQRIVLERGDLSGARNVTALLLSRLQAAEIECKKVGYKEPSPTASYEPRPPRGNDRLKAAVEDFLLASGVDGRAADLLRGSPPHVQDEVLRRGSIAGTRNPSAVLLSRLKTAESNPTTNYRERSRSQGRSREQFRSRSPERARNGRYTAQPPPSSYGNAVPPPTSYSYPEAAPSSHDYAHGRRDLARTADIVADFLRNNTVDARAAEVLHDCTEEVQLAVINRGDLNSARNPSAALLSRIRDAQAGPSKAYARDDVLMREVEAFIAESGVDAMAAEKLRGSPPEVQRLAIEKGISWAKNPSSALLARIKDAQMASSGSYSSRAPADQESLRAEVDRFIDGSGLNAEAEDALRAASRDVQHYVISRGGLGSARNPSAVVLARIREAAHAPPPSTSAPVSYDAPAQEETTWVKMRGLPYSATVRDIERFFDGYYPQPGTVVLAVTREGRPAGEAFVAFDSDQAARIAIEERQRKEIGGRYIELFQASSLEVMKAVPSGAPVPGERDRRSDRRDDRDSFGSGVDRRHRETLEAFIRNNELNDKATEALRGAPPNVQREVMERGSTTGTRNPSAVVLSRIRDAEAGKSNSRGDAWDDRSGRGREASRDRDRGRGRSRSRDRGRDRSRSRRRSSWDQQESNYRAIPPPDYYAAVPPPDQYSGQQESPYYDTPSQPPESDYGRFGRSHAESLVEEFLKNNPVDERAADVLRRDCTEAVQLTVINRGDLHNTRNPSAALLARIRDAQAPPIPRGPHDEALMQAVEAFIAESGVDDMAADKLRTSPAEVQRIVTEKGVSGARNPSSALLARIKAVQASLPGGSSSSFAPARPSSSQQWGPSEDEVEHFIATNNVDATAADALRLASPAAQDAVMRRGSLSGARNPSAALLARLRDESGAKGPSASSHRGTAPYDPRVEDFIRHNDIDAAAADALRACPPHVQTAAMAKDLIGARNPSSALLARIRDARAAGGGSSRGY